MAAQEEHFSEWKQYFLTINRMCHQSLGIGPQVCGKCLSIRKRAGGREGEVAINLRTLCHSWCRKLQELELRNTPNCSHLTVHQLNSPERVGNPGPGRSRYKIDEETSLYFRTLAFKWKDIASLLLVSRGTIWWRVRDLGIAEKPGFRNIAGTHLDDVVRSFMEIQGGLVGYLMVRGYLARMGIVVQREHIRKSISRAWDGQR